MCEFRHKAAGTEAIKMSRWMDSEEIAEKWEQLVKEAPKLPEGEEIKKEGLLLLGKMARHTNLVAPNLLQQYTPVVTVEEAPEL